jgi:hypothetical protein
MVGGRPFCLKKAEKSLSVRIKKGLPGLCEAFVALLCVPLGLKPNHLARTSLCTVAPTRNIGMQHKSLFGTGKPGKN